LGLLNSLLRLGVNDADRPASSGIPGNGPRQLPTVGACSMPSCSGEKGWVCSYREQSGRRCETRWCKNHIEVVNGTAYCHRHAGVVRTLSATEGSILEVKSQPSLEDRAVPLLNLICEAIDADVTKLLTECAAGRPGLQVARQKTVQEVWIDQERVAWQVSWGLFTNRGYLLRASIRVGVPEPPVVQAVVANHVIFQDVPYWIARRRRGEPVEPSDHGSYMGAIRVAIERSVRGRMPEIEAQLEYEAERFAVTAGRRY
jgi:hypothetical protein